MDHLNNFKSHIVNKPSMSTKESMMSLDEDDESSLLADLRSLGFDDLKGYLIQYVTMGYYGWYVYIAKDEQAVIDMILFEPSFSGTKWPKVPISPIWENEKSVLRKKSPKTISECMNFAYINDMVSTYNVYTDLTVSDKITSPHWAAFSGFDPYETIKTFSLYFKGDLSSVIKDPEFGDHFYEGQLKLKK